MKARKFDICFKSSGDYDFFRWCYQNDKLFLHVPVIVVAFDAETGISKDAIRVKREDAKIKGIEYTMKFKIGFTLFCILYFVKQKLKSILPQMFVLQIKKRNIDRNAQVEI
ncbi:hypothetical protein [Candidatus Symbiothrix dinenymphae]|uniref:hypothetical protein n=1 Tax=Candidatus Symbiothrix dinenymphae TaxID=467085 RepID=UPI000703B1EB|nr:hypothetical protein [Candidatus Symbiothrix dinenymphae]